MIHAVVKAALQTPELIALVGNRVYLNEFIQKDGGLPKWPAMRYRLVSSVNESTICGTGDLSTDDARFQIDIVADTMRECYQILPLVIESMQGTDPVSRRDNMFEAPDEETRTERIIIEFIFSGSSVEASP